MAATINRSRAIERTNNVFAKVATQTQKNGFVKSFSVVNSTGNDKMKMGQVSASASDGKDTTTVIAKQNEVSLAADTNSNPVTSQKQTDKSNTLSNQEIRSSERKESVSPYSQSGNIYKQELKSTKLASAGHKENIQTIDIRDLQKVFKQSDSVSVPPIPLRKRTLTSSRGNLSNDKSKEASSVNTEIRKSTTASNVSSYLTKKCQEMKERSTSYRYLTKTPEKPLSTQPTWNSSRSLSRTRSSSQCRKYSTDSMRNYTVERSLEILKSPSSKINISRSCSSTHVPAPRTSKIDNIYNVGKLTDHKISSSQVSELWSGLNEEQAASSHVSEMLESEISERMKLEKEVQDLQAKCSQIQKKNEHMEMEVLEARTYRPHELNGELHDEDETDSIYRQKYDRFVREVEITKKRMQQQHEEELEHQLMVKKATDKKLSEALEDLEEEKRVSSQWKRKAQKANSEIQDQRLILEEQMVRNSELEKKQRRFDVELSARQEELIKEHILREKTEREKDMVQREKYSIEQELHSTRLDVEMQAEKILMLNKELEELARSSCGEEEVTQLKRVKQELERKLKDQEEELEELAGQVQMLEQSKLRLEMSLEKSRKEHQREVSVREEEIEEVRAATQKKIKNLEAQLETEQEERHQAIKQKHELERRIIELSDQPPPHDPEIERRLRRDLKRTKALLQDAQMMLERARDSQANKSIVRQLKNQLEDAEFAKTAAIKSRQGAEIELHEIQTQLEEITRTKLEMESRNLQLSREKSSFQTQLEEMEEELTEVMKKYKAVVQQMTSDQKLLTEQNQLISDLEAEKQSLKEQLSDLSNKVEQMSGHSDEMHKIHHLEGKIRDLETRLELEQTTRARLECQLHRTKEQCERVREECDAAHNKELQSQEATRRLQRQLRELREDYTALQQKESEAYQKHHELEMALENAEADLQITKNDLRIACQRIQDLQHALEDDISSEVDGVEDSGSESDGSMDLGLIRSHRHYVPLHHPLGTLSGNNSFDMALQMPHSSFDHDSAFSRWMRKHSSTGEISLQ